MVRTLAAFAVLALVTALGSYVASVPAVPALDLDASLAVQRNTPAALGPVLTAVSRPFYGWHVFLGTLAATALAAWRGGRRAALFVFVVGVAAHLLTWGAKHLYDRPRPTSPIEIAAHAPTSPAYPSGHVSWAASALGALAAVAGRRGGRRAALPAGLLALTVTSLMAWSRVWLGHHFLSDVIGGALLGGAVLLAGARYLSQTTSPPGVK